MGSERLRRALERNRAKRARQEGSRSERMQSQLGRRSMMGTGRSLVQSTRSPLPRRPEPVAEKIAPEVVAEPSPRVRSPKVSRFLSGLWEYLLRLAWLFCGVLILRLIFTNGGVVDFYAKKDHLGQKERELSSIKSENGEIVAEIEKIKKSPEYQKKLVRGHLDFIAPDEFLILFAKEGARRGR